MGSPESLTRGRLLAKNTLITLLGQGAPALVALVTIPILIRSLNVDRYGLLSLCWAVFGYFALFDLGIGRAIIKLVSERLGSEDAGEIPPLVWSSLTLMLIISLIGMLILMGLTPIFVSRIFEIPFELEQEARISFYILAAGLPIITLGSGVKGVLEAQQRFDLTNLVQAFLSIFTYAGPLLVLPWSQSLVGVVAVLMATRLLALGVLLVMAFHTLPQLKARIAFRRSDVQRVLKFGSWMTVSNSISPIMVYLDRFIVGTLISVGGLAFYTTPYEVVTRLWLIPASITQVIFPALSNCLVKDPPRAKVIAQYGYKFVIAVLLPVILCFITFAREGMHLWLGPEFALKSTSILQIFSLGVFFNSLARVPFSILHAAEKPKITAMIHLGELPIFLFFLWILTNRFGLVGAASAWTLRMVMDLLLMTLFAYRVLPDRKPIYLNGVISLILMGYALVLPFVSSISTRFTLFLGVMALLGVILWRYALSFDEKRLVLNWIVRRSSKS